MKKKIFIAAAVLISSTAQAQDSLKLLNEVVITATKFPIKTNATGKVLVVITKDELQKAGGRDITQLITEKTGVYINGFNSNIGKDKNVYVRGANAAFTLITIRRCRSAAVSCIAASSAVFAETRFAVTRLAAGLALEIGRASCRERV